MRVLANLLTTTAWLPSRAPIRGKLVYLKIKKRRPLCPRCKKPFMEPVAGISKRCRTTQRYKAHILWASERFSDLESVRKAFRCSEGYLYQAVYEMLDLNQRKRQYPWPKKIGIDEQEFRRIHKNKLRFATAIFDIKSHRLYELVDGKISAELNAALKDLPGRQNVEAVAIDMAEPFYSFVTDFFPNALVVIDKFHALRLFSKALNRKRIAITGDKKRYAIRGLILRNAFDLSGPRKERSLELAKPTSKRQGPLSI